jgi:hypothetical protein
MVRVVVETPYVKSSIIEHMTKYEAMPFETRQNVARKSFSWRNGVRISRKIA